MKTQSSRPKKPNDGWIGYLIILVAGGAGGFCIHYAYSDPALYYVLLGIGLLLCLGRWGVGNLEAEENYYKSLHDWCIVQYESKGKIPTLVFNDEELRLAMKGVATPGLAEKYVGLLALQAHPEFYKSKTEEGALERVETLINLFAVRDGESNRFLECYANNIATELVPNGDWTT